MDENGTRNTSLRRPQRRGAVGGLLDGLPPLATFTAAMYAAGALLLGLGLLTWQPGRNPLWVHALLMLVAAVIAAWILALGERFTPSHALALTAVQLTAVVSLTWTTQLDIGALANGSVLPIIGAYVTWFLHPTWGRVLLYGAVLGWVGAILQHDDPALLGFATSIAVQTLLAAEAFSRIKARFDAIARTDPLTGVLNRRGLEHAARRALARTVRRGRPLAVVVIDLDDLRVINNHHGHAAGDDLLVAVTSDWTARLRKRDLVARTGGDEFVVVLPDVTRTEAESLVARLSEGSPGAWTSGIAWAKPDDTLDAMIGRADARMYERKGGQAPTRLRQHRSA